MELETLPDGGLIQATDQFVVSRAGAARRVSGSRMTLTDAGGNSQLAGEPKLSSGSILRSVTAPLIGGDGGANTLLFTGTSFLAIRNATNTATLVTITNGGSITAAGALNVGGAITQNGQQVWHAGNFNPALYLPAGAKAADSAKLNGLGILQGGLGIPNQTFIPSVTTTGVMEIGKYIDFHDYALGTSTDYDVRLTAIGSTLEVGGTLGVQGDINISGGAFRFNGVLAGNGGGGWVNAFSGGENGWRIIDSAGSRQLVTVTDGGNMGIAGNLTVTAGIRASEMRIANPVDGPAYLLFSVNGSDRASVASDASSNLFLSSQGGTINFQKAGNNIASLVESRLTINGVGTAQTNYATNAANYSVGPFNGFDSFQIRENQFGVNIAEFSRSEVNISTALKQQGQQVWHAGNLNPAAYYPASNPTGYVTAANIATPGSVLEIGQYIDFHVNNDAADFDVRIYSNGAGALTVTGPLNTGGALSQQGNQVWHAGNFNPAAYQPAGNYQPAGSYQPAGNYAVLGQGVRFEDITAARGANAGVVFLGTDNGTYVYANGSELIFNLNGRTVMRIDNAGNMRVRGNVTGNLGDAV